VSLRYLLKTSRPALWFPAIWLYVVATSSHFEVFSQLTFWIGLLYVTFPANLLFYGWNDYADRELDQHNPRKNNFISGAISDLSQWKNFLIAVAVTQIPYLVIGYRVFLWMGLFCLFNFLYNNQPFRWSSRPPLDLLVQVTFLVIFFLSIWLNNPIIVPWQSLLYLCLFCLHADLIHETFDISADRAGGRRTVASLLGYRKAKLLLLPILFVEIGMLLFIFKEDIIALMVGLFALGILLDMLFLWKDGPYPRWVVGFFYLTANISGVISLILFWRSGSLLMLP